MQEDLENVSMEECVAREANRQKVKNKCLPWVIVLAVLMVGSMAFTGYGLWQNSQDDKEIKNLEARIKERDEELLKLKSELDEDVTSEVSGSEHGPYIENGYFYVPEWGVKYRLSDDLTDYGYAVMQDSLSNSFGKYVVGMTAVDKGDLVQNPQVRYYDDIFTCAVVTITRMDQDLNNLRGPKKIVQEGGAQYVIYDFMANDSCAFKEKSNKVVDRLVDIFSEPEAI